MIDAARLLVVFVGGMLLQWWWSTHFSFAGLAPQVLLVLTVAMAARYGPLRAMTLGFFWGLFLDVLAARMVGANALLLTLVAYATGSVRRQIDLLGIGPQSVMVVALSLVYFLLWGLLGAVFLKTFLWVGWLAFLVDPLYNVLLSIFVYGLAEVWLEPSR